MAQIDDYTKRGLNTPYTDTGAYNALDFAMSQKLQNEMQTAYIGRIDACSGKGSGSGSGTVSATQLTAQADASGKSLPMPSMTKLPYSRTQAGIAALIIEPVPGDIGVFTCCKQDISGIKQGTSEPVPAGSYRQFSQSDSVMVGAIHTKKPEVWIEIKQDKTIIIHAPKGCKIESDETVKVTAKKVDITAPEVSIAGNVTVNGSIKSTGDMTAGGKPYLSHTHKGDSGGTTGAPL